MGVCFGVQGHFLLDQGGIFFPTHRSTRLFPAQKPKPGTTLFANHGPFFSLPKGRPPAGNPGWISVLVDFFPVFADCWGMDRTEVCGVGTKVDGFRVEPAFMWTHTAPEWVAGTST